MRACIRRDASLRNGARVEIESRGQRITIAACEDAGRTGVQVSGVERFEHGAPARAGAFTLTPFVTADSGGDAYAVLVEADGAALLYAADLRTGAVQKLLSAAPHVDALLMDSATVGWGESPDSFPTEAEFEDKFVSLFRSTGGLPLVWCSRQNVDRIHTVYRACQRTRRHFIVDLATAEVLRSPANEQVARAVGERIRVFISAKKARKLTRQQAPVLADIPEGLRIYPEELSAAAPTSVMLFRPGLMQDLERASCLAGARLIFSMWLGYLEYEKANPVLEWLDRHRIPLEQCHAASHAGIMELITLRRAFAAAPVTPIRARQPGRFDELLDGVQRRADGEWFEIVPTRSRTV
jgi:ribonuclease J